jgi:hypothetical protein
MGLRDGVDALIRDNAEGFASPCHAIQEDDALWQRLSEGGRERAKQWELPAMQTALEDLLQRLLRTRLSAHFGSTVAGNEEQSSN